MQNSIHPGHSTLLNETTGVSSPTIFLSIHFAEYVQRIGKNSAQVLVFAQVASLRVSNTRTVPAQRKCSFAAGVALIAFACGAACREAIPWDPVILRTLLYHFGSDRDGKNRGWQSGQDNHTHDNHEATYHHVVGSSIRLF